MNLLDTEPYDEYGEEEYPTIAKRLNRAASKKQWRREVAELMEEEAERDEY